MKSRSLVAAAVGALVLSPLAGLAPASAEPAAVSYAAKPAKKAKLALTSSVAEVAPSASFAITAKTPAKVVRTLTKANKRKAKYVLERRDGTRWVRVGTVKRARTKARFATDAPANAAGSLAYRATLQLGKRTLAKGTLSVKVSTTQPPPPPPPVATLSATLASTRAQDPVSWAVTATAAQAGRPLRIEQYVDGAWGTVGQAGAVGADGTATLTAAALGYPAWLRVVAPEWQGNPTLSVAAVRTTAERVPTAIAHRAGAGVAPEQTLGAVRTAVASGAESMEIDVQLTEDGVPIIVHDPTFARTTNVEEVFPGRADEPVGSFELAEVKQLDAGSWFGAQWAGEEIPTLDEVIAELGPDTHLVLEVKSPEAAGNATIADVLATELDSGALGALADAGRLTVSSFGLKVGTFTYDLAWLKTFAEAHPDVPVGVLTSFSPTSAQLDDWAAWAEEVHAQVSLVDRAAVDGARQRGMEVSVWTPNSAAQMRKALQVGADAVITDVTALLPTVVDPPAPPA